jgi:hypothetical protein
VIVLPELLNSSATVVIAEKMFPTLGPETESPASMDRTVKAVRMIAIVFGQISGEDAKDIHCRGTKLIGELLGPLDTGEL